jgi:hypothetical protein
MRRLMRNPKQWRVCVRENLHWYVCLEHIPTDGKLTVWEHRPGTYTTLLSLDMPHAGDCVWTDDRSFRSPQRAVDYMLAKARKIMARKMAALETMKGADSE